MSSNNQGLIRNIIYGATILGFGAIMYYLFFKPSKLTIKGPAGPAAPKTGKTAASAAAAQSTAPVKSAAKHVVEDVESDEEDEEEDEDTVSEPTAVQAAVEADLREQYDAAVRMAQKLIKCEDHHKALAKLTEALSLAAALPSIPSKELIALYNNRSAMMEKTGAFEESLRDIKSLLSMDPKHLKARLRRARVCEVLGQLETAIQDLIFCVYADQSLQHDPAHATRLENLSKAQAAIVAKEILASMTQQTNTAMPSHAFVRNHLESFMPFAAWTEAHGAQAKEALQEAYAAAHGTPEEIKAGLLLVHWAFVHNDLRLAFHTVDAMSKLEQLEGVDALSLSELYEMAGFVQQMYGHHSDAMAYYEKAVAAHPADATPATPFLQLKMACLHMEGARMDQASRIYEELLLAYQGDEPAARTSRAWVLYHRSSLSVSRDAVGVFPSPAEPMVQICMNDLSEAMRLTDGPQAGSSSHAARFAVLLKTVHIRTHVRAQMGLQPAADAAEMEATAAANAEALKACAALFPHHDSLVILQASALADAGDFEGAIALVDQHTHRGAASASASGNTLDFSSACVVKASIHAQKAFQLLSLQTTQEAQMEGERLLTEEVVPLYEKALSADPTSLEVLCQYGQMKAFIGDCEGCVGLLQRAKLLVRARDEAYDIAQLLVTNEAQFEVLKELRKMQQLE